MAESADKKKIASLEQQIEMYQEERGKMQKDLLFWKQEIVILKSNKISKVDEQKRLTSIEVN